MSSCSSSSSTMNRCFNPNCRELKSEGCFTRRGWRLRNGDFTQLCDRCACTFEEGRFCDTFHAHDSGWRCCESCRKSVHCGCIVSVYEFILLDGGGIQCLMCKTKQQILAQNPGWPTSLSLPLHLSDYHKEPSSGTRNKMIGTCFTGPWRREANLFSTSTMKSDFQSRMAFLAGTTNGIDRNLSTALSVNTLFGSCGIHTSSGRLTDGFAEHGVRSLPKCETPVFNHEEQPISCIPNPLHPSCLKDRPSISYCHYSMSACETVSQLMVSGSQPDKSTSHLVLGKSLTGGSQNRLDSQAEIQTINANLQVSSCGNQFLPRLWPEVSKEQLQRVSGNSGPSITPLFEKVLSASDAGRVGRLVLPKKCAENYFPPISPPEGLPINVQDEKGNEWIFQFRSWTNNSSRMYVLEGLTPCIQPLQLQAGDVVKFSRLEPDGKLIIGFRRAYGPRSDQVKQQMRNNGMCVDGDAGAADPVCLLDKVTKSRCASKAGGASVPSKRNKSMFGSKHKRMKLVDSVMLKVTLEEAQGLFRPSADHSSNLVTVGEFEIEEYEDCPMIGRPTIFARNSTGDQVQWAQCEDCFRWRKLPSDALLPVSWTCSKNSWDPERSSCDAAQELTTEQLADLLPTRHLGAFKHPKEAKKEPDPPESAPLSSEPTSKHPRRKPGCCPCNQPPSGGLMHEENCSCEVCVTLSQRFLSMITLHHERKHKVKEAETACKKQDQHHPSSDKLELGAVPSECKDLEHRSPDPEPKYVEDNSSDDRNSSFSNQIDLNIQPKR